MRIAVLGANGFIGSRTVEMLHLERRADVRPIARTASGLARSARFALDGRVADARDEPALRAALDGCEVVVHAVAGDRATIAGTLAPVYAAAEAAGVRRLVYLSSAAVHGQAPAPGTDERTPLGEEQPLPYNTAKIRAERALGALRERGRVELVTLRPGIVYGPRARWTAGFADDLLAGRAYLVGDGDGICNAIYVDNLVHAIHLASTADAAAVDREAFLVGDAERVTWADLYAPIARALGIDLADVPRVGFEDRAAPRGDWWQRLNAVKETRAARAVLDRFPERLRFVVYSGLGAWRSFRPASATPAARDGDAGAKPAPVATREMALLHACRYKLPSTKAEQLLGYRPRVSFAEACRRSVGWLAFAGYPVIDAEPRRAGSRADVLAEPRA